MNTLDLDNKRFLQIIDRRVEHPWLSKGVLFGKKTLKHRPFSDTRAIENYEDPEANQTPGQLENAKIPKQKDVI